MAEIARYTAWCTRDDGLYKKIQKAVQSVDI